jgi:ankyrin repeat protein
LKFGHLNTQSRKIWLFFYVEEFQASGESDDTRKLLEASKTGDLETVKQCCNAKTVNCRDLDGRHSTPLHFAAGYNRVTVVQFLLEGGADVHAKDKGYNKL